MNELMLNSSYCHNCGCSTSVLVLNHEVSIELTAAFHLNCH